MDASLCILKLKHKVSCFCEERRVKCKKVYEGETVLDNNINFPHLHIFLSHVGKNIMIGNFSIAYYGIIIALGMLAGLGLASAWAKKRKKEAVEL